MLVKGAWGRGGEGEGEGEREGEAEGEGEAEAEAEAEEEEGIAVALADEASACPSLSLGEARSCPPLYVRLCRGTTYTPLYVRKLSVVSGYVFISYTTSRMRSGRGWSGSRLSIKVMSIWGICGVYG